MLMKNQPITFITGNENKAKYVQKWIEWPLEHQKLNLQEIQSLELSEVVEDKVRRAYETIRSPVLVEDVSLVFAAYHYRLPGPFIKWYLEVFSPAELCGLLDKSNTRQAKAEVEFAYFDGSNLLIARGERLGVIVERPQGKSVFGFNPIFQPEGWDKTWGEMDLEEEEQCSMRRPALAELRQKLAQM